MVILLFDNVYVKQIIEGRARGPIAVL